MGGWGQKQGTGNREQKSREQGSEGARERGSQGAREQGNEGTRERGRGSSEESTVNGGLVERSWS